MISKEEIKKELRYIEKLEFNGVANYEHTNAIKKALNYYLEMNGATKEEIRAERDEEIIDLIRNNIAPDTHEQERLIEEIIEMIEVENEN